MKQNPFLYRFPSHRQSQDSVDDFYTILFLYKNLPTYYKYFDILLKNYSELGIE